MTRYNNSDTVSVEPFQERFLELRRHGVTASEICRRLEWVQIKERADTSRLGRTLGLRKDKGMARQRVTIEMAERLAEAMDMDPYEAGL